LHSAATFAALAKAGMQLFCLGRNVVLFVQPLVMVVVAGMCIDVAPSLCYSYCMQDCIRLAFLSVLPSAQACGFDGENHEV